MVCSVDELLAKDDEETLSNHVSDCISVAKRIVPSLPLTEDEKLRLLDDVVLALAFHDVGKAATGFQNVLRKKADNWRGWRHEILSASFASAVPTMTEAVIFAVLTHHKSIPNDSLRSERRALVREFIPIGEAEEFQPWRKMKKEWHDNYDSFHESWLRICNEIERRDLVDVKSLPSLRLDEAWLERSASAFGQLRKKSFEERRYFSLLRGLVMVCDHMASGHYRPNMIVDGLLMTSRSRILDGMHQHSRAFQNVMAETKGSAILRAPTGSGKTEAALLWASQNAEKNSRMYYVLPNIASINAMFERLKVAYGEKSVGLLHSRARAAIYRLLDSGEDLESKLSDQKTSKMLSGLAHSIWFPVRVCTPHQVLRFSLRGRGWEPMLAEFPNSIFIFDEIHAYDPRLVGQILATAKLVKKWNAKCAFLSATMPSFLSNLIRQYVLVTSTMDETRPNLITPDPNLDRDILEKKRHILICDNGTLLDFTPRIIEDMQNGLKVLVVCNTVRASQEVFEQLCDRLGKKTSSEGLDTLIMLIHSRFTRQDRNEKEIKIMKRESQPRILVATQVVEVSLDISYDVAYLEPAPIDAAIQRMGRVNRMGESPPAPIHLMSEEISSRSVYKNRERVKSSLAELYELSKNNHPLSESEMVSAADRVYKDGFNQEEKHLFDSGIGNIELGNFEGEMLAGASEDWKDEVLSDQGGIDVLPHVLKDKFDSLVEKKLIIEAYSLLVPVQYWNLGKYNAYQSQNVFVIDWQYSPVTGLAVDNSDPTDNDLFDSVPSTPSGVI